MKQRNKWMVIREYMPQTPPTTSARHLLVGLGTCLLQVIGVWAVIYGMATSFSLSYHWKWLLAAILLICIVVGGCFRLFKRTWIVIIVAILFTLGLLSCYGQRLQVELEAFMAQLANEAILYFNVDEEIRLVNQVDYVDGILLLIALWFAVLTGFFFYSMKSAVGAGIVLLIPVFLGMIIGKMPDMFGGVCFILSISGLRVLEEMPEQGFSWKQDIMMLCLGILLMGLSMAAALWVHPRSYGWFNENKEIYTQFRKKIAEFDMQKVAEKLEDFSQNYIPAKAGVSGGKINRTGKLHSTGKEQLSVTLSADYEAPFYLRAYTGSYYTSRGWDNGNIDWSNQYEIMLDAQWVLLSNYVNSDYGGYETATITVVNQTATDWCQYIPYFLDISQLQNHEMISDQYIRGTGEISVEVALPKSMETYDGEHFYYAAMQVDYPDNLVMQDEWVFAIDHTYLDWIYEANLALPESGFEKWTAYMQEILNHYGGEISYSQALYEVRNILKDYEYSKNAPAVPRGQDPIVFFLDESKEGYCVYFASAAVMLFRALGIPARYVEGYVVDGLQANVETRVLDSDAHAWVELFVKDFGWVSVEVTVGFYDEELNSLQIDTPETETILAESEEESTMWQETTSAQTEAVIVTSEVMTDSMEQETTIEMTNDLNHSTEERYGTGDVDSSQEQAEKSHFNMEFLRTLLLILLIIFAVCVFVVMMIWLARSYLHHRKVLRERILNQENQTQRALALFMQIKQLCRYAGVSIDEDTENIEDLIPFIENERYARVSACVLKASFSKQGVTKQEADYVAELFCAIEREVIACGFCVAHTNRAMVWLRWKWNQLRYYWF